MLAGQGGVCATCRRPHADPLIVDRSRVTGEVRGLLCRRCKAALPWFRDDHALLLRAIELSNLPFRWDSNAFGSLFWGVLCLHTMHLVAGNAENVLFLALLYRGPVEKKHLVDLEVNGIYWYFVVLAWLPLYAIFYGEGLVGW
jgi:hypothetical protein